VKGSEFLRRLKKCANRNGWSLEWHPDMGKGSHGVLVVNGRRTILRNLADELKAETLHGMLKQLGIKERDL
jgi:mRNA interferase HicA